MPKTSARGITYGLPECFLRGFFRITLTSRPGWEASDMAEGTRCPLEQSSGAGSATISATLCESLHSSVPGFTYLQKEKSSPQSTELGSSIPRLGLPRWKATTPLSGNVVHLNSGPTLEGRPRLQWGGPGRPPRECPPPRAQCGPQRGRRCPRNIISRPRSRG